LDERQNNEENFGEKMNKLFSTQQEDLNNYRVSYDDATEYIECGAFNPVEEAYFAGITIKELFNKGFLKIYFSEVGFYLESLKDFLGLNNEYERYNHNKSPRIKNYLKSNQFSSTMLIIFNSYGGTWVKVLDLHHQYRNKNYMKEVFTIDGKTLLEILTKAESFKKEFPKPERNKE
jgi:hypothetical protein